MKYFTIDKVALNKLLEKVLVFLYGLIAFLIPFNLWIPEISCITIVTFIGYYVYNLKKINENLKTYEYVLCASGSFLLWVIFRSVIIFTKPDLDNIFRYIGILFFPILLISMSTFLRNKNILYPILLSFIFSNFVIGIYSIAAALKTGNHFDMPFLSLFPLTWHVGFMSFSLLFIAACLNHYRKRRFISAFLWIAFMISIAVVYLASRRGVIISVVLTLVLILPLAGGLSRKISHRVVLVLAIIAIAVVMLNNPRFKFIHDYAGYKYDIRLTMWETALKMGVQDRYSLLAGYGLKNGYEKYNQRLRMIDYFPENMRTNFNSAHNDFLDIFIMFGLVGLALFLWLIASAAFFAVKDRNLIFIAFLIMASVQFFFGSYFFWFRSGKYSFFFVAALLLLLNNSLSMKATVNSKAV